MFNSPSSIVVGAGASFDFGLPLGGELWNEIVTRCRQTLSVVSDDSLSRTRSISAIADECRASDPVTFAFLSNLPDTSLTCTTVLYSLMNAIDRADVHPSVDDFIRDNQSFGNPLRALIAGILFTGLYDRPGNTWHLKSSLLERTIPTPQRRRNAADERPPPALNWIRAMVGQFRQMLGPKIVPRFPVRVVNFNYDRLFAHVARHFWNNAEAQYADFDKCFEFIYPYGSFSELPDTVHDAGEWLLEQSRNLKTADAYTKNKGSHLEATVRLSDQIFLIGFSCGKANADLLNISERGDGSALYAQNYGGKDVRLARYLASINADAVDNGSMSELVSNGFFDQRSSRAKEIRRKFLYTSNPDQAPKYRSFEETGRVNIHSIAWDHWVRAKGFGDFVTSGSWGPLG